MRKTSTAILDHKALHLVMALAITVVLGAASAAVLFAQPAPALAKTQTANVVTGASAKIVEYGSNLSGKRIATKTTTELDLFTYGNNGLISKSWGSNDGPYSYSYDSKHRMTKRIGTYSEAYKYSGAKFKVSYYGTTSKYRYFYKNGKIASRTRYYKAAGKWKVYGPECYKYDSKGRISKATNKARGRIYTFKYDSKGNLKERTEKLPGVYLVRYKYSNTYDKSGKLVKQTTRCYRADFNSKGNKGKTRLIEKSTCSYSYKKIRISSKMATRVSHQRWAVLNDATPSAEWLLAN